MKQSNFAARLSQALDARNMKAADLSKKTKVSEGTISCYINGKYEAKQNRVRTFAEALNVNPAWLMGYDVPMDNDAPTIPAGFEPLPTISNESEPNTYYRFGSGSNKETPYGIAP